MTKTKITLPIIAFLLLISVIFLSGCGCKKSGPSYQVSLEVWGLFDDSDVMTKAINEYKDKNPRVREINYKKLLVNSYENDLVEALAAGKGPDVFLIHNTWLPKHQNKLAPAPQDIINLKRVHDEFVDVVSQDFIADEEVYALPRSVDSLALYYNKNLLNQAGLTHPPRTWQEFDDAVKKITKIDSFGNIIVSGAAMGASSDSSAGEGKINRATDILTLLMMQAGAEMNDPESGEATFAQLPESSGIGKLSPGVSALVYYTKFSNLSNEEYCWNSFMHNSVDSFIEGKTAMMINYSWLIPKIQSRAPKLSFGVAPIPQNKDEEGRGLDVNFANYWGFAVSKNKFRDAQAGSDVQASKIKPASNEERITEAWRFIKFLTMTGYNQESVQGKETNSNYDPAFEYIESQKKPAARRDLIEKQKDDILISPFAEGNLIAKSWRQPDNLAVEKIFDEMIDDIVLRNEDPQRVVRQAQSSVNVLMKKE